jgi:hypothetical protein
MAGLVPAIHALLAAGKKGVDARNKCGHDDDGNTPTLRTGRRAAAEYHSAPSPQQHGEQQMRDGGADD